MNQNFIIILSICQMLAGYAQNPNFQWVKQIEGSSYDTGRIITIDDNGNIYLTGGFFGTSDFDPGPDVYNLTSMGVNDIFIQKLDPDGNFLWAKRMGSLSDDFGRSIIVDADGNVFSTGNFRGTVDFDPGSGVYNLTSAGLDEIFIQKLDSDGNFIWAKRTGGSGDDRGYSFTADSNGNIYTTGLFNNTVDFDPGAGTWNITSYGHSDIYIQKLDSDGNFVWARRMGESAGNELGNSINCDENDNIFTTGRFIGTVDFDPGALVYNLTSAGSSDGFVQKLDSDSNFLWAIRIGSIHPDEGYSITTDAIGNVYSTGVFIGMVDFDPGPDNYYLNSEGGYDVYIQKLDSDGNFIWAKSIGGSELDFGRFIHTDANGSVYTIGDFSGTVDFDPGVGVKYLSSEGEGDIFIQKLDDIGDYQWVVQMGGSGADSGNCVTTDTAGNLYSTGYFHNTVDFDPGVGVYNLTSVDDSDIFIQKLSSTLGVNSPTQETSLILHPIPVKDFLTIENTLTSEIQSVNLYDALGRLVLSKREEYNHIDLSHLEGGLYFLNVVTEHGIYTEKILKE